MALERRGVHTLVLCSWESPKAGANFHNANYLASTEADFWEKGFQTQRGLSVSGGNSSSLKHVIQNHAIDSFNSTQDQVYFYVPMWHTQVTQEGQSSF